MPWRDWFKRRKKKPQFDYAAIRIGNVYVLPPTEEDVREFRKKRRREITRRAFVVGGIVLVVGALGYLVYPKGETELTFEELLSRLEKAKATSSADDLIRKLCLASYRNGDPKVRRLAAQWMRFLHQDPEACAALWTLIRTDPVEDVRKMALRSLLSSTREEDVKNLVDLYRSAPWARPTIDRFIEPFGFVKLKDALGS